VLLQCKMYVAALRIADRFGCDLIGIQYQQGLKDLLPASDLVEGMLNDSRRPPVTAAGSSRVLFKGAPLVHCNEVDECAGLDGLLTQRIHADIGRAQVVKLPPAETRRRLDATTPQWPIMHAVTHGVSRDQMMARHKANHVQVAYARDAAGADRAALAKAACARALGIEVAMCGTRGPGGAPSVRWDA
jgi:hypothetical protein